ncbi:MAG: efflux RND transporter periplasmic adaptor subunit [Nitrospirota bacterium]|nr:efflux RND transporter periplasmic adaptor subunit [Nitrospirota bacterium]
MKRRTAISVFLILTAVLAGCGDKIQPGEHKVVRPVVEGVVVEELTPVMEDDYYEASGTLKARTTSIISSKIMGEVKEIKVTIGDRVKKGDLLLVIYSPDIEAKHGAAQEALGEAEKGLSIAANNRDLSAKTFDRYGKLYEGKVITDQEFDEIRSRRENAELRYQSAQSALKKARAMLDEAEAFRNYALIRSPLTGTIAEKNIDTGSMAVPGAQLFMVEESAYRVEASVDEGLISHVRTGSPVSVSIDALGLRATGTVGEIVRQIDQMTRSFLVKIDVKDASGSLRGGLYARASFPVGEKEFLLVREDAVVRRGELNGVYTVNADGIIVFRLVKTGKTRDGKVEILSGLNKGERIIVSGVDRAVDGGIVK